MRISWIILGPVIGGVIGVLLLLLIVCYVVIKRRQRARAKESYAIRAKSPAAVVNNNKTFDDYGANIGGGELQGGLKMDKLEVVTHTTPLRLKKPANVQEFGGSEPAVAKEETEPNEEESESDLCEDDSQEEAEEDSPEYDLEGHEASDDDETSEQDEAESNEVQSEV